MKNKISSRMMHFGGKPWYDTWEMHFINSISGWLEHIMFALENLWNFYNLGISNYPNLLANLWPHCFLDLRQLDFSYKDNVRHFPQKISTIKSATKNLMVNTITKLCMQQGALIKLFWIKHMKWIPWLLPLPKLNRRYTWAFMSYQFKITLF